jgi:hypothetical protein
VGAVGSVVKAVWSARLSIQVVIAFDPRVMASVMVGGSESEI